MNIFLADIRDLTVDLKAPPETAARPNSAPPEGHGESLDPGLAGQRQVVEFNEFFDQLNVPMPAPAAALAPHSNTPCRRS